MNKDYAVIYASSGQGHTMAARALADHFNCPCIDLLDYCPRFIRFFYSQGYYCVVNYFSLLWLAIFKITTISCVQRWIEKMHLKFFQPFLQFLKDNKVQYLIVTHFFPIHLVKTIKADSNSKLIVVVTDLGAHPLWVDSQVDLYCVPLDFTRQELIEQGVDESKIAVTGMPLRQGFLQPVEPQRVREELSFDDKPVILVLSSTHKSLLYLKSMVKYLTKDFNLVIIYGNNREAKKFLTQVNNKRVRSFQYYGKIWQLMALASFIITKPGGLTVFEGLYMNKPLIFTHFIFGQEKRNMEIIQTLGKGFYAPSFKQLKDILYYSVFSRDQDRVYNVKNKNIFTAIESKVDR